MPKVLDEIYRLQNELPDLDSQDLPRRPSAPTSADENGPRMNADDHG